MVQDQRWIGRLETVSGFGRTFWLASKTVTQHTDRAAASPGRLGSSRTVDATESVAVGNYPFVTSIGSARATCVAYVSMLLVATFALSLDAADPAVAPTHERSLDATDVGRIREAYHLTDVLKDRLWPGFDLRKIPIAVNNNNRQELLVGHPAPPPEFRVFEGHAIDGQPVLIRDGFTHYGPRGGGWTKQIAGRECVYVSVLQAHQTTEVHLLLLLHEGFHVFQDKLRNPADGRHVELSEDNADQKAAIALESHILRAALDDANEEGVPQLAKMFVAFRNDWFGDLSEDVVRTVLEQEFKEGTATYAEVRTLQLLAEMGGVEPVGGNDDPHYDGFSDARRLYRERLDLIVPPEGLLVPPLHAYYNIGMAQCLLLDRVRPAWKTEMREKGATPFSLLSRQFPLDREESARLTAAAKQRFGYSALLAEQTKHVAEQLATIRSYLDAPGRRYRVHYSAIPGAFRWDPKGPVFRVPCSLLEGSNEDVLIWVGGIPVFEKGKLVFRSKEVPVIFRHDYLEWIDSDPAKDGGDVKVESERFQDGVYHKLRVETDGFVVEVPRAKIEYLRGVFTVYGLPEP